VAKGLTKRAENYSDWYQEVVANAELADNSPVRGCMVIRPHGYAIWEKIQGELDRRIKETGHVNAYFPIFIPESFLHREAKHVEGFSPECAVVTHGGGKKLEEPLVVRPTSETVMYAMYSQWIKSYRDLPLLINQWANVVRWEMRPRLFLRTTEFLWQEGHTAHATEGEAEKEALMILDMYTDFVTNFLAIPVLKGRKSESEKFPGAVRTYTIEGMMQDRRALQCGTSHNLGQNFSKADAFNVAFQDEKGATQYVHQTSWGVSTRLIGGVIMTHSDDDGLVLPPNVAPIHVVVIPIYKQGDDAATIREAAHKVAKSIDIKFAVKVDDRDTHKPGFKFFEWEKKGVPLRLEIGPRDLAAGVASGKRRDNGEKVQIKFEEIPAQIPELMAKIQNDLLERARKVRNENTIRIDSYADFKALYEGKEGFTLAHWCGNAECEAKVKEETKATIRLIPFEEYGPGKCMVCGKDAPNRVVFARAY
jgi:prolyl-tRNA synthetase